MKTILLCVSCMILLAACNTFEGIGQDIKGAGEWTSESAKKVEKKL